MFVAPIHVTHNDKRRINFSYRKALTAANLFPPLKNIKKKRWRDAGLSAAGPGWPSRQRRKPGMHIQRVDVGRVLLEGRSSSVRVVCPT